MQSRRRRAWVGFVPFAALGILALFVLHGAAAGVASLLALLALIGAGIYALRRQDPDNVARNERTGFTGWWWF
jgi:hypothetical protein